MCMYANNGLVNPQLKANWLCILHKKQVAMLVAVM